MYFPKSQKADKELKAVCYNTAYGIYGKTLPYTVLNRLEAELKIITQKGYSLIFMIMQKAVAFSESRGYHTNPRGCVGNSLAAYFSGISNINPLPPHYICSKCHHAEFPNNKTAYSHYDLPDAFCPVCGAEMSKSGYDLNYEFLFGADGNKIPDIDINFSDKIRDEVCEYLKTTFCDFQFMSLGHPTGFMIIPKGSDISDFLPFEKKNASIEDLNYNDFKDIIYRFDFVPVSALTEYKYIEELTGIPITAAKPTKEVFKLLFSQSKDILIRTGASCIPEFDKQFLQILTAKFSPTSFTEIVGLVELTHGIGAWEDNAEALINAGIIELASIPSSPDDIMNFLINKGFNRKRAYEIADFIRFGYSVKSGYSEKWNQIVSEMNRCEIPDWFTKYCGKIQYLSPKTYAIIRSSLAVTMAWYKIYYPTEFYCAYFSVNYCPEEKKAYEIALIGKEAMKEYLEENYPESVTTDVEKYKKDICELLLIFYEALSKGIKLLPPDPLKSHKTDFLPEKGAIKFPLSLKAEI